MVVTFFNDFHVFSSTHLAGPQILRPFSDFIVTYPGKIIFKHMKPGLFPSSTLKFFYESLFDVQRRYVNFFRVD